MIGRPRHGESRKASGGGSPRPQIRGKNRARRLHGEGTAPRCGPRATGTDFDKFLTMSQMLKARNQAVLLRHAYKSYSFARFLKYVSKVLGQLSDSRTSYISSVTIAQRAG